LAVITTPTREIAMQHVLRQRISSISDVHIHRCDCEYCDGTGRLAADGLFDGIWDNECPACEGMGYLDPSSGSDQAYQVYLADLYSDVVRELPQRATIVTDLNAA
jgi:hypothetical protein